MAGFQDLPEELVEKIINSIDNDGDLGNLALTCRCLHVWILPSIEDRYTSLTITSTAGNGIDAAVQLQKYLLKHLGSIMTCPNLRYLTKTASIGFVAISDVSSVSEWYYIGRLMNGSERKLAQEIVISASRRAGFGSRGLNDEDNIDFLIELMLILSPNLKRVEIDKFNVTLCQILATVAGFIKIVQHDMTVSEDTSIWARQE